MNGDNLPMTWWTDPANVWIADDCDGELRARDVLTDYDARHEPEDSGPDWNRERTWYQQRPEAMGVLAAEGDCDANPCTLPSYGHRFGFTDMLTVTPGWPDVSGGDCDDGDGLVKGSRKLAAPSHDPAAGGEE